MVNIYGNEFLESPYKCINVQNIYETITLLQGIRGYRSQYSPVVMS